MALRNLPPSSRGELQGKWRGLLRVIFKALSQGDLATEKIYVTVWASLSSRYMVGMTPIFPHLICIKPLTQSYSYSHSDSLEGLREIFKVIILENSKKIIYKTESSAAELLSLSCFYLPSNVSKLRSSKP